MKKPEIKKSDVHFVVNAKSNKLKCFDSNGKMRWMVEAHCIGVKGSYLNKDGNTPPGLYSLGAPDHIKPNESDEAKNSYGPWFVPLQEEEGQLTRLDRKGLGVHGGGTGLANPYRAANQGWMVTRGCIRLQNENVIKFANTVFQTRRLGGKAWLSVHW